MNCKQNTTKKKCKGRNLLDVTNFNRFEKLRRSSIRQKKSNSADATKNDVGRNQECSMRNDMDRSRIFYDLLRTPQYLNGNYKEKK